jgi:hypothetical protein
MMHLKPALTLVVPGLNRVLAGERSSANSRGLDPLRRWLARGERIQGLPGGYERGLFALAGWPWDAAKDIPVAAVARLGEGQAHEEPARKGQAQERLGEGQARGKQGIGEGQASIGVEVGEGQAPECGWWLRADPVHLRADRDKLLLLPGQGLGLTAAEAGQLADACNRLVNADGWHLEALDPLRWYLKVPKDPSLRTVDPDEVYGQAISDFLPRGDNSRVWRRTLTELQMVLHTAAPNVARERRGMATANGVWLWGSGQLPAKAAVPWRVLVARDVFAVGLARLAGAQITATVNADTAIAAAGRGGALAVVTTALDAWRQGEAQAGSRVAEAICRDWLDPVYAAVARGQLPSVLLVGDAGAAFLLDRTGTRRFWRRSGDALARLVR